MENLGVRTGYEQANENPEVVFTKAARALIKLGKVDALLFAQNYNGDINQYLAVPKLYPTGVHIYKVCSLGLGI